MGMGFVDEVEFNKELERLSGIGISNKKEEVTVINEKVIDIKRGRGEGRKEVPDEIRKLAAEESICGSSGKDISEMLGISQSSISAYKNGYNSTSAMNDGVNPNEALTKHNEKIKNEIGSTARSKLMEALEAIDGEKLSNANVKVIASVAKDLSFISKNMERDPSANNVNVQQVLVYRPRMKEEDDYNVITVNE